MKNVRTRQRVAPFSRHLPTYWWPNSSEGYDSVATSLGRMRAHTPTVEWVWPFRAKYSVTLVSNSRDAGPTSPLPKSILRTMLPRPLSIRRGGVNETAGVRLGGSLWLTLLNASTSTFCISICSAMIRNESPEDDHLETKSVDCREFLKSVLANGKVTLKYLFVAVVKVRVDCILGLVVSALLLSCR